jgi:hypothetical protein
VIAIDAATEGCAGSECSDFVRVPNVPIRGRRDPREVWVLRLPRE